MLEDSHRTPLLSEVDNNVNAFASPENSDENLGVQIQRPNDAWFFNYIVFAIMGVSALLPWTFFTTATDYWMYKFRDINDMSHRTDLQTEFMPYLSISSTVSNFFATLVTSLSVNRVHYKVRVYGSLFVMLALFILTSILAKVDTDGWESSFFVVTVLTAIVINFASSVFSCSIFGITAKFPSKFISAYSAGMSVAGIIASLTQIASLAVGTSSLHSAFVYFVCGSFLVAICIVGFFSASRSTFFCHQMRTLLDTDGCIQFSARPLPSSRSMVGIFKKIWMFAAAEMAIFVTSLAVYPSVTSLVQTESREHTPWNDKYFTPVVAYLLYSVVECIGRIIPGHFKINISGETTLIFSALRIVFIPLIMFCNAQPRRLLPVAFPSEYEFAIIMLFFALSNGYLSTLAIVCVPSCVEDPEKEQATTMVGVFISAGLAVGSIISYGCVKLL